MRILTILFILLIAVNSEPLNIAKLKKFAIKGKKLSQIFCNSAKLPKSANSLSDAILKIKKSNACKDIDNFKLKFIAYSILQKDKNNTKIKVPNGAKCSVCGMFVYKYPKWAATMEIDSKKYYFDGVKDMMKYYFFDGDFKYDRAKISKMEVTNYYTLNAIKAKDAFYVYDSKVYGPMGRELIPFSTQKEAESFIADHGGELMKFSDITPKNIMALDGIELK